MKKGKLAREHRKVDEKSFNLPEDWYSVTACRALDVVSISS